MNMRERIFTALHGGMPDHVPWTTYPGVLTAGTTERKLRNQGLSLHSIRGVHSAASPNVTVSERIVEEHGETVRLRTMETPVGKLTEKRKSDPGYSSSWRVEHCVKEPRDYEVVEFIVRDTEYFPSYDTYVQAAEEMGDDGIVSTKVFALPFQRLWIEYTGLDRFLLDLHDYPELVGRVLRAMEEKDRELWDIVADSSAEFVWVPDNVTAITIGPRMFDRYFAPYYTALADVMHRHGKSIMVHMDGALRPLIDSIARTPIDVIEAFTPAPTCDLSVAEARAAWKDKVIWVNFPSSVHIEPSDEVAAVTKEMLRQAAPGNAFLIGITENIPEFAKIRSLTAITEAMDRFGECPLLG